MSDGVRQASRFRWLAGVLLVSLAVNAFLIGAIGTDFLRVKWRWGEHEPRALRFELRWLEDRLDSSAVGQVETAVATARPNAIAHIERLRELRAELARLAAVPQPDRAAIDAVLGSIRTEVQAMQMEVQKVTIDALLALPPEARARLAEAPQR
jgi:uncharacterized membrane protein